MSRFENPLAFGLWLLFNHLRFYWCGFVYLVRQYLRPRIRLSDVTEPYAGTVAVVTGASKGIGLEVVKNLLSNGVNVIIGVRHYKETEKLLEEWSQKNKPGGTLDCLYLDLSSIDSVRRFVGEVEAMQTPINLLINNGGCMLLPQMYTRDGFEYHFQVNYLSHFLLTHLLFPLLKNGASRDLPSRVVNVSSIAHRASRPDLQDLQFHEGYSAGLAYAQSKLCMVSAAVSWNEEVSSRADYLTQPVTFVAVHPGICATSLYQHAFWYNQWTKWIMDMFLLTPQQGSRFVIDAAFTTSLKPPVGAYLEHGRLARPHELVESSRFRDALWRMSRDFVDADQVQL